MWSTGDLITTRKELSVAQEEDEDEASPGSKKSETKKVKKTCFTCTCRRLFLKKETFPEKFKNHSEEEAHKRKLVLGFLTTSKNTKLWSRHIMHNLRNSVSKA